jgi:hypothetical protein
MNPLAEDRLRASMEAEADRVEPSPDSLDTIRTRVRGARRRRRTLVAGTALAAVVVAAVALPRLGDRADDVSTANRPSTTQGPSTTERPPPTGVPGTSVAIWPAAGGTTYADPSAATVAFLREVVGVDDAPLSEFSGGDDAGAGTVDVHARGEDGHELDRVVATVALVRDGGSWFVAQATSGDVVVDAPAPDSTIALATTVTGRSRGFEGTVVASLVTATSPDTPVAQATAIGGSGDALEHFSADLAIAQSPGGPAILVTRTDPAIEGGVPAFDARGVTLPAPASGDGGGGAGGPSVPGETTTSDLALQGQPLWPFATGAEVDDWRAGYAEGGHQPWHLDPEETALDFARNYLGFTELDVVTSQDVQGREAWIGVGSSGAADGGGSFEAAVVHVVRWGDGDDAPWEVVGTRDTDLTLDVPRYGSSVTSPVTVGGTIQGVDENLRVQVHQLSSEGPIGESCCVAAGTPRVTWETSVSYEGATDHTLTIVVSTGGHRQQVERFAVTGVRR